MRSLALISASVRPEDARSRPRRDRCPPRCWRGPRPPRGRRSRRLRRRRWSPSASASRRRVAAVAGTGDRVERGHEPELRDGVARAAVARSTSSALAPWTSMSRLGFSDCSTSTRVTPSMSPTAAISSATSCWLRAQPIIVERRARNAGAKRARRPLLHAAPPARRCRSGSSSQTFSGRISENSRHHPLPVEATLRQGGDRRDARCPSSCWKLAKLESASARACASVRSASSSASSDSFSLTALPVSTTPVTAKSSAKRTATTM